MPDQDAVRAWIAEFLAERSPERELPSPDADLYEAGFLDSLGIILLISSLEERFALSFVPENINEDSFRSINAISALILAELPRPEPKAT